MQIVLVDGIELAAGKIHPHIVGPKLRPIVEFVGQKRVTIFGHFHILDDNYGHMSLKNK